MKAIKLLGIVAVVGLAVSLFAQSVGTRRPTPLELDQLVGVQDNIQAQLTGVKLLGTATVATNLANESLRWVVGQDGGANLISCRVPNATAYNMGKVITFRNASTTNLISITNEAAQYIVSTNGITLTYYKVPAKGSATICNVTGTNWWLVSTP